MSVTLTKQIDELTIEEYTFHFMDNNILFLNTYRLAKKEKRQRFHRTIKSYDRLRERDSTMTEDEVPFTPEIRQEAIDVFTKQIKCLKWSEKYKR